MKFYLSSYRIPNVPRLLELLPAPPGDIRTALIPNAKDYYAQRAWDFKTGEAVDYLKNLGFQPAVVDLRRYEKQQLQAALENCDFIWVNGGNTFCLRYEMRRSGFEEIIKGLLGKGIVYGGESAGAIAAGSTLRGSEKADEPMFAAEQIYEGLNLVPHVIIPHADNPVLKDGVAPMIEMYAGDPNAVILNDDQAFVVSGPAAGVVGAS